MSAIPISIKGRNLVGALRYYGCDRCDAVRSLVLTGFEGSPPEVPSALLSPDGALFFFREWPDVHEGAVQRGGTIRLLREVGRAACPLPPDDPRPGDHVWFDWEFVA